MIAHVRVVLLFGSGTIVRLSSEGRDVGRMFKTRWEQKEGAGIGLRGQTEECVRGV